MSHYQSLKESGLSFVEWRIRYGELLSKPSGAVPRVKRIGVSMARYKKFIKKLIAKNRQKRCNALRKAWLDRQKNMQHRRPLHPRFRDSKNGSALPADPTENKNVNQVHSENWKS
jgi:hypothetical protein